MLLVEKLALAVLFLVLAAHAGRSQELIDDDDVQLWNEANITIGLNDKIDLFVPTSFRLTQDLNRLNEGRIGIGIVFKPHPRLAITPFYSYIRVRNQVRALRTENRYHLRFVYRFPTKKIGLTHRSQVEYRHTELRTAWRYRPSITLETKLPTSVAKGLSAYVTEEPFYDSRSGRFSRNRLSFGVNKSLSERLSLDVYYLRQDDNFSIPRLVHVLGTGWKIKL